MKSSKNAFTKIFGPYLARPEIFIIAVFCLFILLGSVLLSIPIAHGESALNLIDIIFTVTSAVCVTGLTVVDTAKDYSFFGQVIILLLIQLGGLGIMTLASLTFLIGGRKLSLRSQAALGDTIYQRDSALFIRKSLKWILLSTFAIEVLGALILYLCLPSNIRGLHAIFVALFHAISAFCNAGFSTFSDNLMSLQSNIGFLFVISILIILGGIGYPVLMEVTERYFGKRTEDRPVLLSLGSRVVIRTSFFLILCGGVVLIILGLGKGTNSFGSLTIGAFFHAVSARTAGFNSLDLAAVPTTSLLFLTFLMFIGGSPASCAGGVKTTSFAIALANLHSFFRGRQDVLLENRRIAPELVRRALTLIGLAVAFNFLGVMVLSWSEQGSGARFEALVFEQVSAFGTVGLSAGVTASLSTVGKLWIILTMFVGRVGPLTLGAFFIAKEISYLKLPEEEIMIG